MGVFTNVPKRQAGGTVLKFPAKRVKRQRRRPRLKAVGLVALAVAVAIGGSAAAALWTRGGEPGASYVTVPAARGAVTRTITTAAAVTPARTVDIGARVSGAIAALICDEGSTVKAGQVCAKIDPRPYQAALDQYDGALMRDQAILDGDRAALTRLEAQAARNPVVRRRIEPQRIVVRRDEGAVKLDQALRDGARLNLEYTDVVAPADGIVVARAASVGQVVAAGAPAPALFVIATALQVEVPLNDSDAGTIKAGDPATVTVDALPQHPFKGAVRAVRPAPQGAPGGVYVAVIDIGAGDAALKPGMAAAAQIVAGTKADVLRVPDAALRYRPAPFAAARAAAAPNEPKSAAQIFVLRDGKRVAVNVAVGRDDGRFSEIADGDLKAGDEVITADNRPQQTDGAEWLTPRL